MASWVFFLGGGCSESLAIPGYKGEPQRLRCPQTTLAARAPGGVCGAMPAHFPSRRDPDPPASLVFAPGFPVSTQQVRCDRGLHQESEGSGSGCHKMCSSFPAGISLVGSRTRRTHPAMLLLYRLFCPRPCTPPVCSLAKLSAVLKKKILLVFILARAFPLAAAKPECRYRPVYLKQR